MAAEQRAGLFNGLNCPKPSGLRSSTIPSTSLGSGKTPRVVVVASVEHITLQTLLYKHCSTNTALQTLLYNHLVDDVISAVKATNVEFVGIFDAISLQCRYPDSHQAGSGVHLACTRPPPATVPENVQDGMIFCVNDIADSDWESYVTPALESGGLKALPEPLWGWSIFRRRWRRVWLV